jgi:nitrate/TMAO reductase-like tetraheme cytochrome c subunit
MRARGEVIELRWWPLGSAVLLGFAGAIAIEGTFQYTKSQSFCTSCHVMSGVEHEWTESVHGRNAKGIEVGCADCHVPPGRVAEARAKLHAIHAELLPWLGGVRRPEQIEERRLVLAERVWEHLRETDSAACRSCHRMSPEALALQETRARAEHLDAAKAGQTCIECHDDGIAHSKLEKPEPGGGDEWKDEDFDL